VAQIGQLILVQTIPQKIKKNYKIMKQLFLLIFVLIKSVTWSQEVQNLKLYWRPGMILFNVSADAPHESSFVKHYIIEKMIDADTIFREFSRVYPVNNFSEYEANQNTFFENFEHLHRSTTVDQKLLFSHVSKGNLLSDLGSSGAQLSVLSGFNLMAWDKDVSLGRAYKYRVLDQDRNILRNSEWVEIGQKEPLPMVRFVQNNYNSVEGRMNINLLVLDSVNVEHIAVSRTHFGDAEEDVFPAVKMDENVDSIFITITDTSLVANRIYDYKFKTYDIVGNTSDWSPYITLISFDYLQMPLPTKIMTYLDDLNSGVKITWELENYPLISKLDLYRSNNSVDGFELIASIYPGLNEYIDNDLDASQSYFYYFEGTYKMFDTPKRGIMFSAFYAEDYPPLPPELETVFPDQNGITIRWNSYDRNILGFRVYRALDGEDYQLVSDMIPFDIDNPFYEHIDTDSTLLGNKYYNYSVKAITKNLVESIYSNPMIVRPLINVPVPIRPIEPEAYTNEGRILVFWNVGVETNSDFLGYRIIRLNTKEPFSRDTFYTEVNMMVDSSALPELEYRYTISENSIYGTISPESDPVNARIVLLKPPPPLSLSLGSIENAYRLMWELPSDGEYYRYNIYRYQRGGTPEKIGVTSAGAESFTDLNPIQNQNLVFYIVRSVDENGLESDSSNEVSVRGS
jgi:fibronectin type 3 domain-containing protein